MRNPHGCGVTLAGIALKGPLRAYLCAYPRWGVRRRASRPASKARPQARRSPYQRRCGS